MGYEQEYHQEVHAYLHDDRTYALFARINRKRYFSRVNVSDRVYEYGCDLVHNLYGLPTSEKLGYDTSEYARAFATKKGLKVVATLEGVARQSFDFAISRHTMEHVDDPLAHLHLLRGLLKPQGWLILIVPEESVHALSDYKPDVNNHLFSWTPRTLANLLYRSSFDVASIRREPNSGLRFFASVADRWYGWYRVAMQVTDWLRDMKGEWVVEAQPRG